CVLSFFFQAEDGIRDFHVTGVQTCALPIYRRRARSARHGRGTVGGRALLDELPALAHASGLTRREARYRRLPRGPKGRGGEGARSEERRVGKGGRARG